MAQTYALFDDAGKFLAGRVMSEADSSLQIELDSGKRVKVKSANVMLRFDKPAPAELIAEGLRLSEEIDLDLAWEFAPEEDFAFGDFAKDYFEASAGAAHQAAALFRLHAAPHYFRRAGKGQFRKAPEDIVKAALLGIERKAQQTAQIEAWAGELAGGACPTPIREQLYKILFKPDKNAPEYKAVVDAAKKAQRAPLDLLLAAGAIDSPYQFHWQRFLFEQFPKGTGFPAALSAPEIKDELPLAAVQAFSVDDSATTEIDDALSVQGLGTGTVIFGVHIAAPALAVQPDSAIDKVARDRFSTVYMPGWKLTMLPDEVVQRYTLMEGRDCPAVSLYVTFDESTLEVKATETKVERVPIAANLRHDKLDAVITEDALNGTAPADFAFVAELSFGWRLAQHLKAAREVVRGKPENFNRADYNFKLVDATGAAPSAPPAGDETVLISERRRGAPLDLIVAEAMILANNTWGGWLNDLGVPGIYRTQASMAPGVKVRMGTRAQPHAGMGVAHYTWATSPLRRYVDLVNQWQIIACARHGRTAALAAPFKPKDTALFAIISGFDAAYSAYNDYQRAIERYWTLRWLTQNGVTEIECGVMKDGLVRADTLPLVLKALGAEALPRGARVRVRLGEPDLLTLDIGGTVSARLDDPTTTADDAVIDEDAEEGAAAAAPLALAIDLQDASADTSDAPDRADGAAPAAAAPTA
jgi:exoribonuclease II